MQHKNKIVTGPSRTGPKPEANAKYDPEDAAGKRTCQSCHERKKSSAFEKTRRVCRKCRSTARQQDRRRLREAGRCTECKKPHSTGKRRCPTCAKKHHSDYSQRRDRRLREKQCVLCGETLVDLRRQRCETCADRNHDWRVDRRQIIKEHIIRHYGGECACCRVDLITMLTIDHDNGGGNEHRRQLGINGGGLAFYQWLIRSDYPEGFSVLCYNCNLSKHLNGGVCEHVSKRNING